MRSLEMLLDRNLTLDEYQLIRMFVAAVEERAERTMEVTGKLEGAYYAAMRCIVGLLRAKLED